MAAIADVSVERGSEAKSFLVLFFKNKPLACFRSMQNRRLQVIHAAFRRGHFKRILDSRQRSEQLQRRRFGGQQFEALQDTRRTRCQPYLQLVH